MKLRASATVVFSLVFMLVFCFILSFFELAAYTARASYHASAGLLATENYFAAFLEPLYEQYHIFAREVPEGEDVLTWTEESIAEDVLYMTEKKEGEKSLLLRGGADFSVASAEVLSACNARGFYSQAVTAMKYRGVLEVVELLKEMAGMTEQVDANLEVAAAKAATDSAYGVVDEKILNLIELVDGVNLVQYGEFLGGKNTYFQTDVYAQYFCTDMENSADYFDRTEVYQAFLNNSENPEETLAKLLAETEALVDAMKVREESEARCEKRIYEISEMGTQISAEVIWLDVDKGRNMLLLAEVQKKIGELLAEPGEEAGKALEKQMAEETRLIEKIEWIDAEKERYDVLVQTLFEERLALELELWALDQEKREQEKTAESLRKEEECFLQRCQWVAAACMDASACVEEIRTELENAKKVRATCETVLDTVQFIVGEEAVAEYQKELEMFDFYESAEGYDFDRMKQTLSDNSDVLTSMVKQFQGTDRAALEEAIKGLKKEKEHLIYYSFEGLKLNYGEMSLGENFYDGVEATVSGEIAKGFLGFLTEEELSEKAL